jgi:hypothetical protein
MVEVTANPSIARAPYATPQYAAFRYPGSPVRKKIRASRSQRNMVAAAPKMAIYVRYVILMN